MTNYTSSSASADRMPLAASTDLVSPARRISWGAVLAGTVIAVVVQLVLSLIGAGIGLSTVDPLRYASPEASTLGIGAAVWWAVASMISLFAGGWVAGHTDGTPGRTDGVLHGLLTWSLATLLTVYLLASAIGSVVRGGASVMGAAATATAAGAAAVAGPAASMAKQQLEESGISIESLTAQAKELLMQTGKPQLQAGSIASQASAAAGQVTNATGAASAAPAEDIQAVFQRIITAAKKTVDQADREALINVVMARTGASRADAEQRADTWINRYQQARVKLEEQKVQAEAKAREVADASARASSRGALAAAAALILGAIAAALGGRAGARRVREVIAGRTATRVA